MAERIAEAFVKLFADDTVLKQQMAQVPAQARAAGTQAANTFADAWAQAMTPGTRPGRSAFGVSPAERAAREAQVAAQAPQGRIILAAGATEAMERQARATDQARRAVEQYGVGVRDARGVVSGLGVSVLSELNPALAQGAGAAIDVATNLKGMGVGAAAAGGGLAIAATALAIYISRVKAANEAEVNFQVARRKQDYGAMAQQVEQGTEALERYEETQRLANQQITGFGSLAGATIAYWSNFGTQVDVVADKLAKAREEQARLFALYEKPRMQAQARIEDLAVAQKQIELDREAAGTAEELVAATDRLAKARADQAQAQRDLIEQEVVKLDLLRQRTGMGEDEYETRLADIRRRQNNITKELAVSQAQLNRETATRAAMLRSGLIEHEERLAQARRDAVNAERQAAQQIATIQVQAFGTVQEASTLARQVLRDNTQAALSDLRAQTAAQRAALQEQLQAATGPERTRLEQQLTELTAQEESKRRQIRAGAAAERARIAEQERQALVQQAEVLFGIQTTLGQRSLRQDLDRWTQVAQAARDGSRVQIEALQRVAAIQKQVQEQARGLVQQALSISERQYTRLGLEAPEFIDKEQVAQDIADAKERAREAKAAFDRGESVRRSDLQDALQQEQFFEQFALAGGRFAEVFRDAITPVAEAFQQQVGDRLTEQLDKMTGQASEAFTGMVAGVEENWQRIEEVVGAHVDAIVEKIRTGQAEAIDSIANIVEDRLARRLHDSERAL